MDDVQASDKKHQGVSLKKIGNTWLLKYHGKLRRLNLLQGAVNVHIEDNVICADDVLYNIVVKSEEDIFLEEIKDINIQATATQTTEQTEDVEEGDNSNSSPELFYSQVHKKGNDIKQCKDQPDDGESDKNGSTDVSDNDSDLEKGHEEYVKKKGKLKVFFDKMKKLVKRKPPPPPKMQLLSKNSVNIIEAESVATTGVPGASENVQRGFSVTVIYDFVAEEDGEITVLTDDTITDVDPIDEGWLIGTTSDGTRGLFPASYVLLSKNSANIIEAESVATTGVPGASENVQRGFSVTVKYDFVAEEDGEITVLTDDTITDVDPIDEGWLIGTTSDGTRGLFPASYVVRI